MRDSGGSSFARKEFGLFIANAEVCYDYIQGKKNIPNYCFLKHQTE